MRYSEELMMAMPKRMLRDSKVPRTRAGFSLLELLFVISIMVVLIALVFPVFKSIRESNQLISCTSRLQRIGQALRLYYVDERGVPPYYINPTTKISDITQDTVPEGLGLMGLLAGDYIRDRNILHCPRAVDVRQGDSNYYHSYDERDATVEYETNTAIEPYGMANCYKYLSTRGIIPGAAPTSTDYSRQLTRCDANPDTSCVPIPVTDMNWQPDDTTVVTWCDYHADSYTKGGDGQYNVLFWDGTVACVPQSQMRDTAHTMPPSAAWRVTPK